MKTKFIYRTLILVASLAVQACGGGGNSPGDTNVQNGNQTPSLAVRIAELKSSVSVLNGLDDKGLYQYNQGLYNHRFGNTGRSFCIPQSPYVAPDVNNASGTTTAFGCVNNIDITYSVMDPTKLQVIVSAPKTYTQVNGNANYLNVDNNYSGYMTADNLKIAFDVSIIDNQDGTYSLGTVSYANLYTFSSSPANTSFTNLKFITNNTTVNQFIANGDLLSSSYVMISSSFTLYTTMTNKIANMGKFIF